MFCPEPGCTAIFSDEINFEEHIQEGYHTEVNAPKCSAMDHIRTTFASELKISSKDHLTGISGKVKVADIDMVTASDLYPTMNLFKEIGWALPTHSTFRYTLEQKRLLYKYFIEGEKSGKKMSLEQVEMMILKDLKSNSPSKLDLCLADGQKNTEKAL